MNSLFKWFISDPLRSCCLISYHAKLCSCKLSLKSGFSLLFIVFPCYPESLKKLDFRTLWFGNVMKFCARCCIFHWEIPKLCMEMHFLLGKFAHGHIKVFNQNLFQSKFLTHSYILQKIWKILELFWCKGWKAYICNVMCSMYFCYRAWQHYTGHAVKVTLMLSNYLLSSMPSQITWSLQKTGSF